MSNIENEGEKNRLWKAAKIDRRRTERRVKISWTSIEGEDLLLRKLCRQLEKFCQQEQCKKYQIKARSKVSPVKKKAPTENEKAKEKVKRILEQKDEKKKANKTVNARTFNLTKLGENLLCPARTVQQLLSLTYMEDISHTKELVGPTSQVGESQLQGLDRHNEEASSRLQEGVRDLGGELQLRK